MSLADLLGKLPIARGAKVDDAKETKQVREGKMSRLPTFPWGMIPSEKRLPLFWIMLFFLSMILAEIGSHFSGSCLAFMRRSCAFP
jgi:hypothetical protein